MIIHSKHPRATNPNQSGNVFFFIMLGIVLFAALSYAVVGSSSDTSSSMLDDENAKITTAQISSYAADMRAGLTQLQLDGCRTIDYTPPEDQVAADRSCHIFHADGAGIAYKNIGLGTGCPLTDLEIGDICNGVVYAGELSGTRIYTTASDLGSYRWNNGEDPDAVQTSVISLTAGDTNTDSLVNYSGGSEPYQAAQACRALGSEWYLPALNEVILLYTNHVAIGNFYTGTNAERLYWSSSENSAVQGKVHDFNDGTSSTPGKSTSLSVRCTRRD